MISERTISKAKEYLKLAQNDALTPEEARAFLRVVVSIVKQSKEGLENISRENIGKINEAVSYVDSKYSGTAETLLREVSKLLEEITKLREDFEGKVKEVMTHKPKDGISPPLETIAYEASKLVERKLTPLIPKLKDIEEDLPRFRMKIKEGLEMLNGNDRLDKSAIKGLDDELQRISAGGGVSNLRIQQAFKYILKTEAPTGTINGVNTEFTVTQPIFAVLAFSLNGETIAQLPNYTISGNKVTFSAAIPAAYSGKDFEIKYI